MPDNSDRACWAREAVDAFRKACGTDEDDAVADLICNLCHLVDMDGGDPISEISRGLYHHYAETHHEQECVVKITVTPKPRAKASPRASEKLPPVLDALQELILGIKKQPFHAWPHEAIAKAEAAYVDAKGQ